MDEPTRSELRLPDIGSAHQLPVAVCPELDDGHDSTAPEDLTSTYRDEGIDEPARPPFTYSPLVGTSQAAPHLAGPRRLEGALRPAAAADVWAACADGGRCALSLSARRFGAAGRDYLDVESLLLLTQLQSALQLRRRSSTGGRDELAPPLVHTSIWDTPVVKGGFCALSWSTNFIGWRVRSPCGGPAWACFVLFAF